MQETSPTSSPAASLAVLEWIFNLRYHELVNKGWRNREFQSTPTQRNHGTLCLLPSRLSLLFSAMNFNRSFFYMRSPSP